MRVAAGNSTTGNSHYHSKIPVGALMRRRRYCHAIGASWSANAYQVLFTWSETGEGFFEYYDKKTDEIIKIDDVPGWQCRHYYFGAEQEEDLHCWHAAYTECQRITLAYQFVNNGSINNPEDAQARAMRDMLIEEIETE